MSLVVWDVEHGACTTLSHIQNGIFGRLAMIDSGHASDWRPSQHIRQTLNRNRLDYLFITNADQDHMSDLNGLWEAGIYVATLYRNPYPSALELRNIKLGGGYPLSDDIERYLDIHENFTNPVTEPFDQYMGGITARIFFNSYPEFTDTNNLSCAVFIQYHGFKILFPGDLEEEGWLKLLQNETFVTELEGTNVLVASHHGRERVDIAQKFLIIADLEQLSCPTNRSSTILKTWLTVIVTRLSKITLTAYM